MREILKKLSDIEAQQVTQKQIEGLEEKVDKILRSQIEVKTTLYGADRDKEGGICTQVKKNTEAISNLRLFMAGIGSIAGGIGGVIGKLINW